MCGRYTLSSREHILKRHNLVLLEGELLPRYNISPTQKVPVIIPIDNGKAQLTEMRWGLIPSWTKDLKTHRLVINARAETLAEKPSFKQALIKRRCLIPADGFYEWKTTAGSKVPQYIHLKDNKLFAFAGLWEQWTSPEDGEVIRTCVIITVPANTMLAEVHDRMPAILRPESEDAWLETNPKDTGALLKLLCPYPNEQMEYYPVSKLVNSAKVDSEECATQVLPTKITI